MDSAGHGPDTPPTADAAQSLERISAAVRDARSAERARPGARSHGGGHGSARFLVALALLRDLQAEIAAWEPELIDAARSGGASWAQLAPALGVASRQAAERRYLRLRPSTGATASTGDERVRAERDKRAADRAVRHWARRNAADLRQLAGQVSALDNLPAAAQSALTLLRQALGAADTADLLHPLAATHDHLQPDHPALAARIRTVSRDTETVRAASDNSRRAPETPTRDPHTHALRPR
jgi:hypothetical protein